MLRAASVLMLVTFLSGCEQHHKLSLFGVTLGEKLDVPTCQVPGREYIFSREVLFRELDKLELDHPCVTQYVIDQDKGQDHVYLLLPDSAPDLYLAYSRQSVSVTRDLRKMATEIAFVVNDDLKYEEVRDELAAALDLPQASTQEEHYGRESMLRTQWQVGKATIKFTGQRSQQSLEDFVDHNMLVNINY